MLAELYVLSGRDAGKGLTAGSGPSIFLGRAATNHIRVRDPQASRVHCRVEVTSEGLVLHDEKSGNGTYVNGERVQGSRRLADQDEIQLGETRVKVLVETDADRARWQRGRAVGDDGSSSGLEASEASGASSVVAVAAARGTTPHPLDELAVEDEGDDEGGAGGEAPEEDEDALEVLEDEHPDEHPRGAPSGPRGARGAPTGAAAAPEGPSRRGAPSAGPGPDGRAAPRAAAPPAARSPGDLDDAARAGAESGRTAAPRSLPTMRGARASDPPSGAGDDAALDDERRPLREVLPGYRLETRLGGGSRGGVAVYRATQRSLDRPVAIKVLLAKGEGDQRAVARFLREARAIARLPHPGIVTIHDVLRRGPLRAIVMELVGGGSLSDRLEAGPLPADEALEIGLAVARALAHLHAHGVAHRAVTPGNVLHAPEVDAYKLTGFAFATAPGGERAGDTTVLEGPSEHLAYAPPELLADEGGGDARSDVYGLGATLWACLAGRAPFAGPTASHVAAAVLRDEPPPLVGVPSALRRVLARCLAKAPGARLPDGAALLHELAACRAALGEGGR